MKKVREALENLHVALEARDVAVGRAVEVVYAQFASIVARREREYDDALRLEKED
jgi:hypothetical protein